MHQRPDKALRWFSIIKTVGPSLIPKWYGETQPTLSLASSWKTGLNDALNPYGFATSRWQRSEVRDRRRHDLGREGKRGGDRPGRDRAVVGPEGAPRAR